MFDQSSTSYIWRGSPVDGTHVAPILKKLGKMSGACWQAGVPALGKLEAGDKFEGDR